MKLMVLGPKKPNYLRPWTLRVVFLFEARLNVQLAKCVTQAQMICSQWVQTRFTAVVKLKSCVMKREAVKVTFRDNENGNYYLFEALYDYRDNGKHGNFNVLLSRSYTALKVLDRGNPKV